MRSTFLWFLGVLEGTMPTAKNAAVSARTASEEGVALKTRPWIVIEGVFARIKELLHWTRCRCWGKAGATAELTWRSLAHNLMLLSKQWEPMAPATAK